MTGKEEVYCAASSFFEPSAEKKILKITGQTHVDSIPWVNRLIDATWTNKGFPLFTAGDGIFENTSGTWREIPTGIYAHMIRGTALNNIFAVGDFGYITHYDGETWQQVGYDYNAVYTGLAVMGNLVVAVGEKDGRAIATIGRRQ